MILSSQPAKSWCHSATSFPGKSQFFGCQNAKNWFEIRHWPWNHLARKGVTNKPIKSLWKTQGKKGTALQEFKHHKSLPGQHQSGNWEEMEGTCIGPGRVIAMAVSHSWGQWHPAKQGSVALQQCTMTKPSANTGPNWSKRRSELGLRSCM